jgi:DNA replication and repair protein RecF
VQVYLWNAAVTVPPYAMRQHLQRLSVLHFRNHREAELALGPEVNCITGPNGTGKTNLLDAVHYLGLCKSYFEPQDALNILHGEEMFLLRGTVRTEAGTEELACSVRKGARKVFTRDRKEYDRLSDHVGRLPVVMITPYDGQLVLDGSELRRRFLDGLIAQFDRGYLEALLRYNRALVQRNLLLKRMGEGGGVSAELLEPWDAQLAAHGRHVHAVRTAFMAELVPLLEAHYSGITSGPERVGLTYRSELNAEAPEALLDRYRGRDLLTGYTTAGVHKDDLLFTIDDRPLKRYGSQGQQKTYLIALKLAQFDLTTQRGGRVPILLLDDIFDKIDPQRMRHLLRLLGGGRFGQVIITDTDAGRLRAALDGLHVETRFFTLEHISLETPERAVVEGRA